MEKNRSIIICNVRGGRVIVGFEFEYNSLKIRWMGVVFLASRGLGEGVLYGLVRGKGDLEILFFKLD